MDAVADVTKKIATYERISGITWIVLGVLQTLAIVLAIAGIWNIVAGVQRLKIVNGIEARKIWVPLQFENETSLIVMGLVNFFLGGFVGVAVVAFDVYIRNLVLQNRAVFDQKDW